MGSIAKAYNLNILTKNFDKKVIEGWQGEPEQTCIKNTEGVERQGTLLLLINLVTVKLRILPKIG